MSSPILNIEGPNFTTGLGVGQNFLYVPDVTSLRGANSIEALTTVGLSLNTLILVTIDGNFEAWQLYAGDADGNDPENSVQPLDYDATANSVHWHCVGKFKSGLVGIQMTRATAQAIPGDGQDYAISFDTQRMNTGEWNLSSPTRFTCVTPGVYAVSGSVSFDLNTSGQRRLSVRKNGGSYVVSDAAPANQGNTHVSKVSTLVYLLTGDYLELVASQTSGTTLNAQKAADFSPEFSVIWLGNPIAQAMPGGGGNQTVSPPPLPPIASQQYTFTASTAGWFRLVSATLPVSGRFDLSRISAADNSVLDISVQFGVFGDSSVGTIQVPRNSMNAAIPAVDQVRVSYEGTSAYVDVHVLRTGDFTVTRIDNSIFVDAPYSVSLPGADGQKTLKVQPNVVGSTDAVDVPKVTSSGIQIATNVVNNWILPTGATSRTSFDPSTVTLQELAKRVAALIIDEQLYGSIQLGLPSSMIYTDMLSLADNLVAENTSVNVSDIFRITAAPNSVVQGIYVPFGTAGGKSIYHLQGYRYNTALTYSVQYDGGTTWNIYGPSGLLYHSSSPLSAANPWLVTQWKDAGNNNVTVTTVAPNITLIYNVLTDTHTACYVQFNTNPAYNGVYNYVDTLNGKRRYYQLGNIAGNYRIEWDGTEWLLKSDSQVVAKGQVNTTYPDQALVWSPDCTVSRIDASSLASGVIISGGGSDFDGVYIPQYSYSFGNQGSYMRVDGARYLLGDGGYSWWIGDAPNLGNPKARSSGFGIFPWQAPWDYNTFVVIKKLVAGPTNWHV